MLRGALRCAAARVARSERAAQRRPPPLPAMCAKHIKKGDLPTKVCVKCNRPFNW